MKKKQDKKQKITFSQLVQIMLDPSSDLPNKYWQKLSDIQPNDAPILKNAWSKIPVERRLGIMEDLAEFNENDDLLNFSEICRLAIQDPDSRLREIAIRILATYQDEQLIPTFVALFQNDPAVEVRAVSALALGVFIYLGELEELDEQRVDEIVEVLLQGSKADQPELIQRRSLEALSFSNRAEVVSLIESAYKSKHPEWIASALLAMSRNLESRWHANVISSLDDDRPEIRTAAVSAAGEMEIEEAREKIIELLHDPEEDVQDAAIWSLSQIGGSEAQEALERLLDETEDEELADFIEEALENLLFTDDLANFELMDLSEVDEAEMPFDEDSYLSGFSTNGNKPH